MKYMIKWFMVLRVAKLLIEIDGGAGQVTGYAIARWSPVSQATTYRILNKMTEKGLLSRVETPYKNTKRFDYGITPKGYDFLSSQKELL